MAQGKCVGRNDLHPNFMNIDQRKIWRPIAPKNAQKLQINANPITKMRNSMTNAPLGLNGAH